MRIVSAPGLALDEAFHPDREILCLELDPATHLLLWSCRELIMARLEDRAFRQVLSGLKGAPDRSSTILLRLLISELITTTKRDLHFGLPHCQSVQPDELIMLAAIDRAQVGDETRCGLLLQGLNGSTDINSMVETVIHLGRALKNCGIIIRVMRLVPTTLIPSIH